MAAWRAEEGAAGLTVGLCVPRDLLVTARALHSRSFFARRDRMHAHHETAHDDRLLAAPLPGAQNLLRIRCGWLQRCGRLFCARTLHLDGFQCLVESLEQGLSHILAVVAAAERG